MATEDGEALATSVRSGHDAPLGTDASGNRREPVAARFTPLIDGSDRLWGWLAPMAVSVVALVLRVLNLDRPHLVMFDETYYAKDAYSLLQHGYVREFTEKANERILAGNLDGIFKEEVTQVVHPDGGKWMIALGEQAFGMNPFGWRVSAAVAGALMVLVLARCVRRLTGSTLLGCVAALALTFDGLHLVMSRIALLDIFLAFWIVCGVACLVADRDWARTRLARTHPVSTRIEGFGPVKALLFRPWRMAAGVSFGLACSTKWSGVVVLAAFGLLSWVWDVGARRAIGVRAAVVRSSLVDGLPAFVSLVGVGLVVYLATWWGFFTHHELYETRFGFGYGEGNPPWGDYLNHPSTNPFGEFVQTLRSLWHFHELNYRFHTGDYLRDATHPYQSQPQGWLLLNRPVGFDAQNDLPPNYPGCTATEGETCLRQVLALGNPVVWWAAAASLPVSLGAWILKRDWRFGIPIVGLAATWLPWFRYDDRPIFFFYAIAVLPFTVMSLALVLGLIRGRHPATGVRGRRTASTPRQWVGLAVIVGFLAAAIVTFAFFFPIWTDAVIPRDHWQDRMWFDKWV